MSQQSSPLIAPFQTGLETDLQPWIAPQDSFSEIDNINIEHGYLEKRNGFDLFGGSDTSAYLGSGLPVTGLANYILTLTGAKLFIAFDTTTAYKYDGSAHTWSALTPTVFAGSSTDFVWTANWVSTVSSFANRMYFTNGLPLSGGLNGLWYYDGGATCTSFVPYIDVDNNIPINGAKMIFSLGQRLILLYTNEDGTEYPQRARWCAKQNPREQTSGSTNGGWVDSVAGGGAAADAATSNQIVSARILQNVLIVFFTDSIWALEPTSDPNKAFRWRKINSYRSAGGRMASVSYDETIRSLGNRGIMATNGPNSQRIDGRISDFTINEIAPDAFDQVFCQRDFNNRRWWTLYNYGGFDYPNRALLWDDDSGAFTTATIATQPNADPELFLTVLGYGSDGFSHTLNEYVGSNARTLDQFSPDETLDSFYSQFNGEYFVAGSADGYIYEIGGTNYDGYSDPTDPTTGEIPITATFLSAAWNPFKDQGSECLMPYVDIFVDTDPRTKATIDFYKDTDVNPYASQEMDFLPSLNFRAPINSISQDNPANVEAFNHGLSTGDMIFIYGVEGMIDVNSGNSQVGYTVTVVDDDNFTLDGEDSSAYDAYTDGGGLYDKVFYRTKTWKRVFAGGIGFQHRIGFTSTGVNTPFRIHGFKPYFKQRGRRLTD
jgi:hypothetical protein